MALKKVSIKSLLVIQFFCVFFFFFLNLGPLVKYRTLKICRTKDRTKKLKTNKEEKAGDCHYIRRKLLDFLLNMCWSVETHLLGPRSEWGEMISWAVTFSGPHLSSVTFSSATGTGITLQHIELQHWELQARKCTPHSVSSLPLKEVKLPWQCVPSSVFGIFVADLLPTCIEREWWGRNCVAVILYSGTGISGFSITWELVGNANDQFLLPDFLKHKLWRWGPT